MLESGSAERAQAAEAPAWALTWSDVGAGVGADVDADVGMVRMWGGRGCTERDGGPAEHRDSTHRRGPDWSRRTASEPGLTTAQTQGSDCATSRS